MKHLTFLLLFVAHCSYAQYGLPDRNWHLRIPIDVGVGLNFADFDNTAIPTVSQGIGTTVAVNPGIQIMRKELYGLAISGGPVLNSYNYFADSFNYNIALLSWRAEGRAFGLIPLSDQNQTHFLFGLSYGYTFFGRDTEIEEFDDVSIRSEAFKQNLPFLIPELGISKRLGMHRMDLALRFQINQPSDIPAFQTVISQVDQQGAASTDGQYLALMVRFQVGFEKQPMPILPLTQTDYWLRQNDTVANFSTKRTFVTLDLWDNAEEDGDTLTVLVNGNVVLHMHALTREKRRVKIPLRKGQNTVLIIANSEGTIAPNTAQAMLKMGRRKELLLRTGLDENDVIEITRF